MRRGGFLTIFLAVCVCTALSWVAGPVRADTVTLVIQNNYPTKHSRLGEKTVGKWLDEVEKRSGGRISFQRHWAGEPIPAKEALDALTQGVLDMLVAFPPYYSGQVAIADICAMPKNFKNPEDVYDLWFNSDLGKLVDGVYQKRARVKVLFPLIFAPENFQVGKKTKKVRTFEDFKGMKIRAGGGMLMETVKAIGASPVHTHGGEYYTAMQRGTIDAGLMATYSLETYKMWEVCDQIVNPAIMNNCFVLFYMGLDRWNSLDQDLREIMISAARDTIPFWNDYLVKDEERIQKAAEEKGVEFFVLPPEEQQKMWDATDVVWDLYVDTCEKQGAGGEANAVREIVKARFQNQ